MLKDWLIAAFFIIITARLAYYLAFYPGSNVAPLIIAVIVIILTLYRPVIGIAIYLVGYPLVPGSASVDIVKVGMLALTCLILFIWWWQNIRDQRKPWLLPEYKWLFIFFLYLGLSPLLGLKYGFGVMDWARDIAPLLNLLLIPVLADYFKDKNNRWLLYLVFIPIAAGMMRDILFLLHTYGFPAMPFLYFIPVRLSTFHPGLFFGLGLILYIQKAPHKRLWLLFVLLSLGVSLLTPTRTVWLALGFMVGLLLIFYSQHRRKAVILIIVMLAIMGLVMARGGGSGSYREQQTSRYQQFLGYQADPSVKSRFDELYQTMDLFKSSPIYGVGFGYQYHFWRHWVMAYKGSGYFDTNFTHNDITNFAAKGGLAGLILLALALRGLLKAMQKKRLTGLDPLSRTWAVFGIIAVIQSFFVGLSTPVYQTREAIFILAVIIAISLSYNSEVSND
ncbi:MAG: O-antigen ligase family protein [Candidatus Edwardsbacteria bacterium]|nr:O-antigen ligase family protein [Candidatus Edwardsbacteria bacterium]